jgi:hypothetical protein
MCEQLSPVEASGEITGQPVTNQDVAAGVRGLDSPLEHRLPWVSSTGAPCIERNSR